MVLTPPLPAPGYALDPATGQPAGDAMPGYLRLLTPVMNVTGALALLLGALFSTYMFMPKRRVLALLAGPQPAGRPLPVQPADRRRSRSPSTSSRRCRAPSATLLPGRLHSRVPATSLIALGAFFPTITDSLNRAGSHGAVPAGQVPGRRVPVRRVPRLGRGLPRDPHPVHVDPARRRRAANGRGAGMPPPARATGDRAAQPATRRERRRRRLRRAAREPVPGPDRRSPCAHARGYALADGRSRGHDARRTAPPGSGCCSSTTTRVVRRGLLGFFELLDDIEVVGEADNGRRAVEQVGALMPDVVLMDLLMPVMDGIAATADDQGGASPRSRSSR